MANFNFDFNGDSLPPEQDNLFDDLLDDLAFETEIANYDTSLIGWYLIDCFIVYINMYLLNCSILIQISTSQRAYWVIFRFI